MKRKKFYTVIVVLTILSLCGLLVVQVNWFYAAYKLEEKQLDEKIILGLRGLADQLLVIRHDTTSQVEVRRTASNAYEIDFNRPVEYASLDSLVRKVFSDHGILIPFELMIYDDVSKTIAFGNFYANGVSSIGEATCLERVISQEASMDIGITFPQIRTDILRKMSLWIFSAVAFIFFLALFSAIVFSLSRDKQLAELKAGFINNMTHELQTPIANISLASEVLIRDNGKLSREKATHYAQIITAENQRLKSHVEQVLQTAMLDKGELALKKRAVDLNALIEDVISSFRMRVQSRGGQLKSDLAALQPILLGDPFHLKNIFYNLLDNADKYSPLVPDITISTRNSKNGLQVAISDKGMGIKKDSHERIFDKFYRESSGDVHDIKGFGLGLTYVREIVKAHQGKVFVTSELNKGTCFEVHFQNS